MDDWMWVVVGAIACILILIWYGKADPTPEQSEMLIVTLGVGAILIIFLTLLFGW